MNVCDQIKPIQRLKNIFKKLKVKTLRSLNKISFKHLKKKGLKINLKYPSQYKEIHWCTVVYDKMYTRYSRHTYKLPTH